MSVIGTMKLQEKIKIFSAVHKAVPYVQQGKDIFTDRKEYVLNGKEYVLNAIA